MDVKVLQEIKSDVSLLQELNEKQVADLSQVAWEFILQGVNRNVWKNVSQVLRLELSAVESAITGIAFLLMEAAKYKVTEEGFIEQASPLELPLPVLRAIHQCYTAHEVTLANVLKASDTQTVQFRGLQWRLESQLASRSLRGGLQPRVVLQLELEREGKKENVALVSDIPNVMHWSRMVDQALAEGRTNNARKIQRAVS